MNPNETIHFHQARLDAHLNLWLAECEQGGAGAARRAAAYGTLEDLGMLYRLTGDVEVWAKIRSLPEAAFVEIVRDACLFIAGMNSLAGIRELLQVGAVLKLAAKEALEAVMLDFDDCQTALGAAKAVGGDLCYSNAPLRDAFVSAIAGSAALEKLLLSNIATVIDALGLVLARAAQMAIRANPAREWWLDATLSARLKSHGRR